MTDPYLNDPDVTIYQGHVGEILPELPDAGVDCVICSPPYWGLRDYGTGTWEGGDPGCDHLGAPFRTKSSLNKNWGAGYSDVKNTEDREPMRDVCTKCGARRIDNQIGLEPTPQQWVDTMVGVFREVRRVLAPHGTCWVNLGDTYNANQGAGFDTNQDGGQRKAAAASPALKWGKPKDLVGIPWRFALAAQADGWYLRADIIWAKPNPMPESVTDRPTKAHEYVFLLTKQPRYWYDADAVREPQQTLGERHNGKSGYREEHPSKGGITERSLHPVGRNSRSVWTIPPQPYPEAHFATYPEELVRRALLAGCPERVCETCGEPSRRIVDRGDNPYPGSSHDHSADMIGTGAQRHTSGTPAGTIMRRRWHERQPPSTVGWTDCGHNAWRPGVVLDPFLGSGTTAHVARKHGRRAIGVELNPDYCALAAKRLAQQSLLAS